jgi:hypothetical protein
LSQLRELVKARARVVFDAAVERTLEGLKAEAPVDTGELRDSGYIRQKTETGPRLSAVISFEAEQGVFTDEGTKPHKISVRTKKVLSDGKNFFGTSVNHPGSTKHIGWFTDAAPFIWRRALKDSL